MIFAHTSLNGEVSSGGNVQHQTHNLPDEFFLFSSITIMMTMMPIQEHAGFSSTESANSSNIPKNMNYVDERYE
jgi:hypothetical protein